LASSSRPRFAFGFAVVPLAAAALALPGSACGDGGLAGDFADTDAQSQTPPIEGGFTGDDGGATTTTLRLAHLAPELGAIDFCWRPVDTGAFEGPVFGGAMPAVDGGDASADADADADEAEAAAPHGVVFRTVSTYQTLARAGAITIAIVLRDAGSCANPIVTGDVTLDAGKLSTVVVLGRGTDAGASSLGVVAFTDDRTTTADMARVRLVHAALAAGTLAVRASSGTTVTLADALLPRKTTSMVPLGYATVTPVPPPASIAITETAPLGDAAAAAWQSSSGDLGLVGGSIHTGFVLDGEGAPFEVLWCTDTSTTGDRTTCDRVR
jgi:hypothetical protein